MNTITVRNIPDRVHQRFSELAKANHRNSEAHARYLIEREVESTAAETCGELADRIWSDPAPTVDPNKVETYLATRGRRSHRP